MLEVTYKVGDWTIRPDLNQMSNGKKEVILEPRVLALLDYFANNQGRVLSRDELTDKVWQSLIVNDNTINYTIGMLRRALGDKARSPQYIQTVAKKGYRLIAEVSTTNTVQTSEQEQGTAQQPAELQQSTSHTTRPSFAVSAIIL
ncbi:MAG: transcriptional regulator, partial [Kordiimonas sp.]